MNSVDLSNFLRLNYPINSLGRKRSKIASIGINDADYRVNVTINEVRYACPAYDTWKAMIQRCFDESVKKKLPSYADVTACDEWISFMSFRDWWVDHCVDGFSIDKDLLIPGSRVYSPETCAYIPQWLNVFITDRKASGVGLPRGVYINTKCYSAKCKNTVTGKHEYLGSYPDAESAGAAWRARKLEIALELKPKMDAIDSRIYTNIIKKILIDHDGIGNQ